MKNSNIIMALFCAVAMTFALTSCNKNEPDDNAFGLQIKNIFDEQVTVEVKPNNDKATYFWACAPRTVGEEITQDSANVLIKKNLEAEIAHMQQPIANVLLKGTDSVTVDFLYPAKEYIFYVAEVDESYTFCNRSARKFFTTDDVHEQGQETYDVEGTLTIDATFKTFTVIAAATDGSRRFQFAAKGDPAGDFKTADFNAGSTYVEVKDPDGDYRKVPFYTVTATCRKDASFHTYKFIAEYVGTDKIRYSVTANCPF